MSIPKKHHYLPEFFMQRWADGDGDVTEYRRPYKDLITKKRHPAATGYMFELYADTSKDDQLERQALELVFMQKVDGLAAGALAHLEAHGSKPKDSELTSAWSRFLLSLMHRSPERMNYYVEQVRQYETETLNPNLKQKYDRLRGPEDPATFEGWLEAKGPIAPELTTQLIRLLIDSDNIGPVLNSMRWAIHQADGVFEFLTGDLPIMISDGLGHAGSFVTLPIGPSLVFIASPNLEVLKTFTNQTANALQRALNDAIVRQSRHVIIGRRDNQTPFVDRRFLRGAPLAINRGGLATWKVLPGR